MKKLFSIVSNLQNHYHFQIDLQKVDQHTGDKWLIHDTKRHKDNQLQSLGLPCRISYFLVENLNMMQRSPKVTSNFQSKQKHNDKNTDRSFAISARVPYSPAVLLQRSQCLLDRCFLFVCLFFQYIYTG